ncbi:hypothetical protein ACO2Q0_10385 [Phenylobacterium sp. VNQ135]|uniref:hypothetical protein n=1 Tax=Phenylobacterium sp. VNQ135 TaxID=3400922 RepID=UPI003C11C266
MLDRDPPLLHGERLLIGAIRRLTRQSGCSGALAHFEDACGWAGPEACRMLEVFLQQLALYGRRTIAVSPPGAAALTGDERTMLDVFGCAQAEAYEAMDLRLAQLLDDTPPASLGAAACVVAETLAANGCFVEAQCWEASTTPSSTAAQWAPAAATTWPCQMARANFRRLFT